jgi:hypothetical protein
VAAVPGEPATSAFAFESTSIRVDIHVRTGPALELPLLRKATVSHLAFAFAGPRTFTLALVPFQPSPVPRTVPHWNFTLGISIPQSTSKDVLVHQDLVFRHKTAPVHVHQVCIFEHELFHITNLCTFNAYGVHYHFDEEV